MSNTVIIKGYEGKAIPIRGNEIDTDRIIPARFMKCVTFAGLGEFAFYDERYEENGELKSHAFDSESYASHPVLVVNKNFGCGSSREHAPQALKDYGIRAIIGESFAEIFAGNCTALGIPAVQLGEDDIHALQNTIEAHPGIEVSIDLVNKVVIAGGKSYVLDMPEAYRNAFLDGSWDSTAVLMAGKADIEKVYGELPYLHFDTVSG